MDSAVQKVRLLIIAFLVFFSITAGFSLLITWRKQSSFISIKQCKELVAEASGKHVTKDEAEELNKILESTLDRIDSKAAEFIEELRATRTAAK